MEYLTYANNGLPVGSFEMDLRDGEVRYKSGTFTIGVKLTPEMVATLVLHNLHVTDHYLPGLIKVLYADAKAAAAIQAIEDMAQDEESDANDLADLLDGVDLDQLADLGDD